MIQVERKRHMIDAVFPVILFFFFAFCVVSMLILSAKFYQSTVNRSEKNDAFRIATSYIREVVRQNDGTGQAFSENYDGAPCLVVPDGESGYVTRIYFYDGMLKEQYTKKDAVFPKNSGQDILALKEFRVQEMAGVLKITCILPDGQEDGILIHKGGYADGRE